MNNYIIICGVFFFGILSQIRRNIWGFRSKLTKTIRIKLSKTDDIIITTDGELAGTLYAHQPKIWANRGFEYKTINQMKSLVKEGDVILDIGANIGMYSIFLSKIVGDNGKVYAFEPNPTTASILKKNLILNDCKNVVVAEIALSDTNSKVTLHRPEGVGDAFNYIKKIDSSDTNTNGIISMRLDDFLKEHKISNINFVKVDIEGAELLCFLGAKQLLSSNNNPIVITECYESFLQRFNHSTADLISYLNEFNYKILNYEDYQWLLLPKTAGNNDN